MTPALDEKVVQVAESSITSLIPQHSLSSSLTQVHKIDGLLEILNIASDEDSSPISDGLSDVSQLCMYCRKIYDHWPSRGEKNAEKLRFQHYGDRNSILDSAAGGCSLCSQFAVNIDSVAYLDLIDNHWVSTLTDEWKFPASDFPNGTVLFLQPGLFSTHEDCVWRISLFIPVIDKIYTSVFVHLTPSNIALDASDGEDSRQTMEAIHSQIDVISISSPGPISRLTNNYRVSLSTMDTLPLARRWLQQCMDEHESCGHSSSTGFVPTRLVDLNSDEPHLHIVGATDSNIQYATLSHCWGLTSYTVLKRSNLAQFLLAIPPEAISTTFQHAMTIAKYLGLHYIWIDSLCIIQDSTEDWQREAALMGSVYGRSSINIAASGAKDGAVGCFFERKNAWICRLKIESEGCFTHYVCLPAKFYVRLLDGMPLMKRAWTLQERILPSRSLHFTQSQLFWECNELHACEALQHGYDYRKYGKKTYLEFNDPVSTELIWSGIISSYSRCLLTMGKDKLIAVSGLAKLVQEKTQDNYIAGLWRLGLETQLCWVVFNSEESEILHPRPKEYRAPTWSWAAVDGVQMLPFHNANFRSWPKRNYISIEDVTVETVSGDPFGEVLSANLVVRCDHLLHGVISVWNDTTFLFTIEGITLEVEFNSDTADDALEEYHPDTVPARLEAYFLPILEDFQGTTNVLVLHSTGAERGQYRRLGILYFYEEEVTTKFQEVLVSGRGKAEDFEYADIFTDAEGKRLQVINIV